MSEERLVEAAELAAARGDAHVASALYERACDFGRAAGEAMRAGEAARALELAVAAGDDALAERAVQLVSIDAALASSAAARLTGRGHDRWAAQVLEGCGRGADAARAWERAGEVTRAAELLDRAGESAQAARVLEAALRRDSSQSSAAVMLGTLLVRFGKWDAAVRALQRVPAGTAQRSAALEQLVFALERLGLSHAAKDAAAELAALGIRSPRARGGNEAREKDPVRVAEASHPRLFGRYDVVREVASSPSARVLECIDVVRGERVAVKLFAAWDARGTGRDALARFEREVRAMRALEHPRVVPLRDFAAEPPALVLAWMTGGTLDEMLFSGQPIAPVRAVEIADSVLSALGEAHRFGILHRDVKPANVLFDDAGAARLGDFGVAHLSDISATATAGLFGTLAYMSPEQRAGRPASARSDLFAVGVMLREMLTGKRPLDGGSPSRPSEAHGGLDIRHDAALDRMTANDPSMRPADAAEARDILFRCAGRALPWPSAAERIESRARGAPSGRPPAARLEARADGSLFDTWTGRAFERVSLTDGSLAAARAFAAADNGCLQRVLRVDREGGAIWLEPIGDRRLDRPLSWGERGQLRRALDALHEAGAVHGHVDREHVFLAEAGPILRFTSDAEATATMDRDRIALAAL